MASILNGERLIIHITIGLALSILQLQTLRAAEFVSENRVAPSDQKSEELPGVEGFASYYAKRYHNRRTNSGQIYNAARLTAAHPTLPHGTRVRVINLANNKEIIVTINDRCRPRSTPFIDLSRAAAKFLGFLGKGMARVRIIPLGAD